MIRCAIKKYNFCDYAASIFFSNGILSKNDNYSMKMISPISYNSWYLGAWYFVYVVILGSTLLVDISCFYTTTFVIAPLSLCLYVSTLIYGPFPAIFITFLTLITMPVVLPLSWIFCVVPLLTITILGLGTRSLLFTLWPVPYCLVFLYAAIQYGLGALYPTALILMPRLTRVSFLVILIVIKCLSLIVLTHPRRGNRV